MSGEQSTGAGPRPYGRQARARIALAQAARHLSESARAVVPTGSDTAADAGMLVEVADRLARHAMEVLELAVVFERERHTSWEVIGSALDISRQGAHERFSGAVERWREGLKAPWLPDSAGRLVAQLPEGADAPDVWAKRLDQWMIEHRHPTDPATGERPVSDGLALADERELESMCLEELTVLAELMHAKVVQIYPETRRHLQHRKLELLERLAFVRPNAPAYAEAAAHARRELKQMEMQRSRPRRVVAGSLAHPPTPPRS
jgi:hypothetical protein